MRAGLFHLVGVSTVAVLGVAAVGSTASAQVELGATAGLHTFSHDEKLGEFNGDPNATGQRNAPIFGIRLGLMFGDVLGLEGEFLGVSTESRSAARTSVFDLEYRGDVIAQFRADRPRNIALPFALIGVGGAALVQTNNKAVLHTDSNVELFAGIGSKFRLDNDLGIRIDARLIFPPSSQSSSATVDFEGLLSFYKEWGRYHAAPIAEAPKDTDGDGIPDNVDKCPTIPEDKDGFQDEDGCPDPDNDGDGVPDVTDKCPNVPEDKDGFQDEDGCPDPDNDGDGIPDAKDKCPNEPEDKDGFQDEDGCPDPDNDGDGIPDAQDKCPNEPETKNGYQDEDGCPDQIPDAIKNFTGAVKGVNFKLGSAELLGTSNKTLDAAVKVFVQFPDMQIEIGGHTDDQPMGKGGKYPDNDALSQARADSVKAYLVKKGVAESRLATHGYGSTVPVVDPAGLKGGKLTEARAKNRRVEFKLVGLKH